MEIFGNTIDGRNLAPVHMVKQDFFQQYDEFYTPNSNPRCSMSGIFIKKCPFKVAFYDRYKWSNGVPVNGLINEGKWGYDLTFLELFHPSYNCFFGPPCLNATIFHVV